MKKILVVDDTMTNLTIIENALKDNYDVTMVRSGEQAIEYLRKNSVDMVLLDLLMPGMDGFETCAGIKQLDGNQDVPVVFMAEDIDEDSEIRGFKMGATDFFRIPFVTENVLNRIERILRLEELTKNLDQKVEEKAARIEQFSFGMMATIAGMVEGKDESTRGHSIRVAEYSALLAKALGWSAEHVQNLRYIALLHDIGKVGIPESVLNKPGELTEFEYDIIKAHNTMVGEVFRDI